MVDMTNRFFIAQHSLLREQERDLERWQYVANSGAGCALVLYQQRGPRCCHECTHS